MSIAICPECRNKKHGNCTEWAIDEVTDDIVDCGCPDSCHPWNPQIEDVIAMERERCTCTYLPPSRDPAEPHIQFPPEGDWDPACPVHKRSDDGPTEDGWTGQGLDLGPG
jgi:hypothetical protein